MRKPTETELHILCNASVTAMKKAYAPYSGFYVGAAVLCEDGSIYDGFNIENSSFSPTVCAERAAMIRAICDGKRSFLALAVVGGPKGNPQETSVYPCGVCRQFLSEFCNGDFIILCQSNSGTERKTLGELLPNGFGKDNLNL